MVRIIQYGDKPNESTSVICPKLDDSKNGSSTLNDSEKISISH